VPVGLTVPAFVPIPAAASVPEVLPIAAPVPEALPVAVSVPEVLPVAAKVELTVPGTASVADPDSASLSVLSVTAAVRRLPAIAVAIVVTVTVDVLVPLGVGDSVESGLLSVEI